MTRLFWSDGKMERFVRLTVDELAAWQEFPGAITVRERDGALLWFGNEVKITRPMPTTTATLPSTKDAK